MANGGPAPASPNGLAATAFFSKTYDEAYALLVDARDYAESSRALQWSQPIVALVHSREAMRVTARVTHMLAWLLVQRAVHAGEISADAAREERYRLAGREVCLDADDESAAALPDRLRELLDRSRKLYQRVARLDEMVARDQG